MLKLSDREWKEFKIIDIFKNNFHGKRLTKAKRQIGNIPLLTASEQNQGVSEFISNQDMNLFCDVITIDMFGHSFYHNYTCCGDDNIYFLINNNISKLAKFFIIICISNNTKKYNYGNQFRQGNLNNDKIMLPINSQNEPDYDFMEKFVKERQNKKVEEYIDYLNSKLTELKDVKETLPLNKKEWKEFFITDIFDEIQRGKRLTKDNQQIGNVPYVSSTATNNGVDNFIIYDKQKMRKYIDCLSVANSGSVGSCFYEPFEFVASDHVTHLKSSVFNKYSYLFISNIINRWSEKYNFNREINDNRISREKIILPIDDNNKPDYKYMENYIKNLMKKKYNEYINYLNNKHKQ